MLTLLAASFLKTKFWIFEVWQVLPVLLLLVLLFFWKTYRNKQM